MTRHEGQTGTTLSTTMAGVAALLLSTAILLMGNGLQGTLIPVRGNIEDFGSFELGLLGTGYFAGFTIGCVVGPALLERGGHIRTFMAMASVASVTALLHVMIVEPLMWALFRALTGFCFSILYVVIESWLNAKSSNEHRGAVFSSYSVISLTVMTVGQMMIGLDDPAAFGLFALASVLVSVATLPIAFTSVPAPATPPFVIPNVAELYRNSPVGFAGCLAIGLSNGAFWTFGPVFAQEHGFDVAGVGFYMSVVVIGGAILQWPLGYLSDRMDRRLTVIAAAGIAAAAAILMNSFIHLETHWLLVLGCLFGAGAFPLYALVVAHANDHAKPEDMVKMSSGLLLVFGGAAAIGPIIASFVTDFAGTGGLFLHTAVVHTTLILFVFWRIRTRARVTEDERVSFNESVISAQTLSALETETAMTDESEPPGPPRGAAG